MRRSALLLLTLAVAAALTACGTKTIDKKDVQKKTQAFFDGVAKQNGQASFPKISCPDDLEAKKGKSTRCKAKGTDGTLGITVTVTDVKGSDATLRFKGDDKLNQ
jgi:hypothetical protein